MGLHNVKSVHAHFEKALQFEKKDRQAYLQNLKQDFPDTGAAVQELLDVLEEAEAVEFLKTGKGGFAIPPDPQVVGPYRIVKVLGRGGMGTVFLAEQETPVHRKVALKLMHCGGGARRLWRRFEREKQMLAFLDHRHITRLYDFGKTAEGDPYFAMEYVPGLSITAFCDHHRYDLGQRLELFIGLCEAVHHAHQKGIIHLDLKPDNVLVKMEDGVPIPKIIDFGIARLKSGLQDRENSNLTTVAGTPAYMSPEQILGRSDLDTRSDIYALGALLYKLLVGCTPHREKDLLLAMQKLIDGATVLPAPSSRLAEIREQDREVAALRRTTVSAINQRIRGDLDRICLKALEQDPVHRYPSASEFSLDVRRFLENRPVAATAPSLWYRFNRFVRRHQFGVAAVSILVLILCAAFWATSSALIETRKAEVQARVSTVNAIDSANRAQAAFTVLQDILASPDPFVSGKDILVSELLDRFPEVLPASLVDDETEALLRYTIGRTYANLGKHEAALVQLEMARELRQCGLGDHRPETMEVALLAAHVLSEQGNFDEAEFRSRTLLETAKHHYGNLHPFALEAQLNLLGIFLERRHFQEAYMLGRQALPTAMSLYGEGDLQTTRVFNYLGQAAMNTGDYGTAEEKLEKAFAWSKNLQGEMHPQTLEIMHNYLYFKFTQNKTAGILPHTALLVDLQERVRGEDHPYTLGAMSIHGHCLMAERQNKLAERTFHELLTRGLRVFGPDHFRLAYCLQYLARATFNTGNYEEAAALIRQAMPIEIETFGSDSLRVAISHYNLAFALLELGDPDRSAYHHLQHAQLLFQSLNHSSALYFTLQAQVRLHKLKGENPGADALTMRAERLKDCLALEPPPSNMFVERGEDHPWDRG